MYQVSKHLPMPKVCGVVAFTARPAYVPMWLLLLPYMFSPLRIRHVFRHKPCLAVR
jgi:hypothetical protein